MPEPHFVESVFHPTDYSEASHLAFAHALAVALLQKTQLTILHVGRDQFADEEWVKFPAVRRTLERWGCLEPDSPRSAVFEQLEMRVTKVNLANRRAQAALTGLALDGEDRLPVLEDDEVDFAPVRVAQEAELHRVALGVLDEVTVLEELARDEVLEAGAAVRSHRPDP